MEADLEANMDKLSDLKADLVDIANAHWILSPRPHLLQQILEETFASQGLAIPRLVTESFSLQMRNHLVSTGNSLTLLPASAVRFNESFFAAARAGVKGVVADLSEVVFIDTTMLNALVVGHRRMARRAAIPHPRSRLRPPQRTGGARSGSAPRTGRR